MNAELKHTIDTLSKDPGVYIYRDIKKRVIYVGKAINLKSRVGSYFNNSDLSPKTRALVEKIYSLQTIIVTNELESLLLEAELIKRYKPPYNINLKDDKFYKYIKIENKLDNLKTIATTRQKLNDHAIYFGPFPESSSITIILKLLRKVFPYKDCSDTKYLRYKKAGRPCLYGFIGACPGPCMYQDAQKINQSNILNIIKYLKGDRNKLFVKLQKDMYGASKNLNYEKAAYIRDQIKSYEYLTQQKHEINEYTKNPNLVEDINREALKNLINTLRNLGINFSNQNLNTFRIETYDISNLQGSNAVGAMVVQTGGITDKSQYRRFRIRTIHTPDDFMMMKEVLQRRFARYNSDKTGWILPDLIVIDGGKGQLSAALEILEKYNLSIPAVGLAKRFEEIVIKKNNDFSLINLKESDSGLNVLKRGRDEAHRFGRQYYRKLHLKKMLT